MSRYSRRVPKESNSKISSSSNYNTVTPQQQTIPGTPYSTNVAYFKFFMKQRLTQLSQHLLARPSPIK